MIAVQVIRAAARLVETFLIAGLLGLDVTWLESAARERAADR
jgi:hypothetical protein